MDVGDPERYGVVPNFAADDVVLSIEKNSAKSLNLPLMPSPALGYVYVTTRCGYEASITGEAIGAANWKSLIEIDQLPG